MSKLTLVVESVPNGTVRASYCEQTDGDDHVHSLKKSLLDLLVQDGSVVCEKPYSELSPPEVKYVYKDVPDKPPVPPKDEPKDLAASTEKAPAPARRAVTKTKAAKKK